MKFFLRNDHLLHRLAILVTLLLAAGLRWMRPGLVEFKYDEAHILGLAQGIASARYWPVLSGGTSIGVQRSALDAYILAAPLVLTHGAHLAAVFWLGMLGVVAVALTYLLGRIIGGRWVGLLAALYMALNPWLVFYDRKFWAHIQVSFSVLLLFLAWRVVVDDDSRARFWFPIVAALQLLTHVLALVQGLSWLTAFLLAPRRWWRRQTLWGGITGLALMSPYLLKLGRNLLAAGAESAVHSLSSGGSDVSGQSLAQRWHLAWQLWSGDRVFELAGAGAAETIWDRMLPGVRWLVLGLMLLGILRVLLWLRDDRRRRGAALLLLWALGPLLAFSFAPLTVYLQYWTVLLPLPALFFALGATWPLASLRQPTLATVYRSLARGVPLLVGLALIIVWAGASASVLARIDAGAGMNTFGRPLREWQAAARAAAVWADETGVDQITMPIYDDVPAVSSSAAAISTLLPSSLRMRFFYPTDAAPALLLHAREPSLYLVDSAELTPVLQDFGQEVWRGVGPNPLRLYLLPSAADIQLPTTSLSDPQVFDAGIALQAYSLPSPWPAGEPALATLVWRITQPAPAAITRDFTAFNHILRPEDDARVAQADGLALLSQDWESGDVLYQGYWLTIPQPGRYEWLTGIYSRRDGERAHLPDGDDGVRIPLVVSP